MWNGSTSLQRYNALRRLGHSVYGIDSTQDLSNTFFRRASQGLARRLGYCIDFSSVNARIRSVVLSRRFDILWIDKSLMIDAQLLSDVRQFGLVQYIVGYSPDDMGQQHNQSKSWRAGLPLYDLYITTKTYNVHELKALGAKAVSFIGNGYDPEIHKPMSVTSEQRSKLGGAIGFIGAWENDRFKKISHLCESGLTVRWWGGWGGPNSKAKSIINLLFEERALWAEDYAKAINCFDINLAFLRKMNRDQQTTRSVEIPACGAFMLGERTDEHLALFDEGVEAEFFSSDQELLDKALYYSKSDAPRKRIASAGRDRCIRARYSNDERLSSILKNLQRLV